MAGVFVSRELAGQSLDSIHEQVQDGDFSTLSRLNKWSQGLRGTRSYWSGVRSNAYAWLRFLEYEYPQMPTMFYTMSAAELHWGWLHKLFDESVGYLDLAVRAAICTQMCASICAVPNKLLLFAPPRCRAWTRGARCACAERRLKRIQGRWHGPSTTWPRNGMWTCCIRFVGGKSTSCEWSLLTPVG